MSSAYTFSRVPTVEAQEAFAFHESTAHDGHVWPRTTDQLRAYCEAGELFAARRTENRQIVGLCYVTLDDESQAWELGGVTVDQTVRKLGIAAVLIRFALAHTIASSDPWRNNQRIIAHVHESNDKPRRVLEQVGFRFTSRIEVPGEVVPVGMKLDDRGNLVGDEYDFHLDGLVDLASWIRTADSVPLRDGSRALFHTSPFALADLREALDDIARRESS